MLDINFVIVISYQELLMVRKTVKQIIKACDLFSHPAAFRYGEQPQYQSLTGGICSIILFCVFAAIFTNTVIATINKTSIDSKLTTLQQEDPTYYQVGTDTFMFGIGITGHNLNEGDRWFNIYLQKIVINSTGRHKTTMELQKCNKQQWTKIKPDISDAYDKIGLDAWLCPKEGTEIQLQGKYSSSVFKYYKFGVIQCNGTINGRGCASNATLQQYLATSQAFTFNFYFINTIINPSNKQYLSSYLDDLNYFPFTKTDGISANFFLSSFTVNTDESIYPYQIPEKRQGGISTGPAQTINYKVRQKDFLKFYLRKSSLSLVFQRTYRKLDDTFSYIGGLFSAIVSVLFIMTKYNEISYQMEIAKNLYHYDRNVPLKSDDFNLLVFFGYLIYAFFETICIKLPWKKMEVYFRSLEQVRRQMDIRLVMKKILYSQRMAIAVFDQSKAKILHLQQPLTLKQAEQIRKDHRFYDKLEKKYFDYKKIRQQQSNQIRGSDDENTFSQTKNKKYEIQENKFISTNQIILQDSVQKNSQNSGLNLLGINEPSKKQIYDSSRRKRRAKKTTKLLLKQTYDKNLKRLQEQRTKSNALNMLKIFSEEQDQKQIQLNCMIENMKQCVQILQKQAEEGDQVSQRILDRFDPKLMKMFLLNQQNNATNQGSTKKMSNQKIQSQLSNYTVNLFSKNQDPN